MGIKKTKERLCPVCPVCPRISSAIGGEFGVCARPPDAPRPVDCLARDRHEESGHTGHTGHNLSQVAEIARKSVCPVAPVEPVTPVTPDHPGAGWGYTLEDGSLLLVPSHLRSRLESAGISFDRAVAEWVARGWSSGLATYTVDGVPMELISLCAEALSRSVHA